MASEDKKFAFNCLHCAYAILRTNRPALRCEQCGSQIYVPGVDQKPAKVKLGSTAWLIRADNMPTRWGRHPFQYDSWFEPLLQEFRGRFDLRSICRGARDELEALVNLRHKVRETWFPKRPSPAFLKKHLFWSGCRLNRFWFCTHYSRMYTMCAAAAGIPARILNISCGVRLNENNHGHMVNDIWSSQYQKWVFMDPLHDFHYEDLSGAPLSFLEARDRFFNHKMRDLAMVTLRDKKGVKPGRYPLAGANPSELVKSFRDRTLNLFWCFYYHGQNYFTRSVEDRQVRILLWRDAITSGRKPVGMGKVHYANEPMVFDTTSRLDVEPTMNNAEIQLYRTKQDAGAIRVYVSTNTPNLKSVRYRLNRGPWKNCTVDGVLLPLTAKRRCKIEAYAQNHAGVKGRPSVVEIKPT